MTNYDNDNFKKAVEPLLQKLSNQLTFPVVKRMGIYFAEQRVECVPSSTVTRTEEIWITNNRFHEKKMRKMEVGTLVVVLHSQNQKVCILSVSDLQRTNFASIKGFVQSYKLICIFFFENMKGRPNSLVLFLDQSHITPKSIPFKKVQLLNSTKN